MGTQLALSQRGRAPIFGPYLLWPNGCMDQGATWYRGRPRPRRLCVRWGHRSPSPKGGVAPNLNVYCGQMTGCIKMSLGVEVGFSAGNFVLDGDPAPYPKRAEPHPIFGPRLLWPSGCMDQDGTWYGGKPRPTRHCVRCGPSYPQKKGHTHPQPIFGPCLLWPNGWMDEDAAWYGSRPRPRPHCTRRGPSSRERGTAAPPLFSAHVYCRHGRQSQLLLSSCAV